jgi:hypothetical protein
MIPSTANFAEYISLNSEFAETRAFRAIFSTDKLFSAAMQLTEVIKVNEQIPIIADNKYILNFFIFKFSFFGIVCNILV